ncbi:hypothetical protein MCOR23_008092 [Pyricularia oryzae]|nr:hypothetical protein MCOR30_009623 [Pyricularia oryzae]KAI6393204.1 hypothetical protein MCOR23_008092 [Pyricularia oryzae]KAI6409964.1 hypothetical protein MCOR24_007194 [Pyricularia oryzae]KAI6476687.1 hypothetical protein MCOR18_006916 [Pyricularia oryzae]KAI6560247.1 hypothetical protein MCOR09_008509 [Pyricularia oryzae]
MARSQCNKKKTRRLRSTTAISPESSFGLRISATNSQVPTRRGRNSNTEYCVWFFPGPLQRVTKRFKHRILLCSGFQSIITTRSNSLVTHHTGTFALSTMTNNYENAEAQQATAAEMCQAAQGMLRQVLEQNEQLSKLAGAVCQTTEVAELANALVTAIQRAVHHHQHADGMAFAIANECVAELREQVRKAIRAAVEAAPEFVLEEADEKESLDLLEAILEDVFAEDALNLVQKTE